MPLLSLTLSGVLAAVDPTADELRRQARAWEARDRADLARQSLEKLVALRSAQAGDLLLLGEMDLQQSDLTAAQQVLMRLRQEFPTSAEVQTLATEVRVASQDRLGLASVHRLVQVGRGEQIGAALRHVFPDGAPNGILGIEYFELLAAAPDGRVEAQNGLWQLMRRHPGDARYTLAVARLLARRAQTARAAVALLEPLRGRPDVRVQAYQEALNLAQATLARAPADTVEEPLPSLDPPGAPRGPARVREPAPQTQSVATAPPLHPVTDDAAPVSATAETVEAVAGDASTPSPTQWIWSTYREARQLAADGDVATARARIEALTERYPQEDDARFARALWEEAQDDRAAARRWIETVPEGARGEGMQALLVRLAQSPSSTGSALVVAPDRPRDVVGWSLQWSNKPGDTGLSALQSVSLPIEWRHELPNHSQWALMAEAVSLDAGAVPSDVRAAQGLGTVAVNGLGSLAGGSTRTQGLALGVAWHHRDWVLDVGTTPLGFARARWTGGVRFSPTWQGWDLSLEGSHRAVTASLLSYAGRVDPGTGRFWGGVMESGVTARVGRYAREHSWSFSVHATALNGTEVVSNQRWGVRWSADQRVATLGSGQVTLGGVLAFESYAHNLLGYTLGNGGYFSPQDYTTVAIPVEWTRRTDQSALRLRFAPTLSHRHDASSPWYPNHPAAAVAFAALGGDPTVLGGTAQGVSMAAAIIYERPLASGVIGVAFAHDRSDYYHPVSLTIYFRPGVQPGAVYAPFQPYMSY
jgi:tetratricopeptide (TPR) repeat protein